ncbi:MAG: FAD-binding oxidoreductase [Hoeflea sp.]|uniref:FAD-binding oxidoreductase n=1 Tax=Hoeflea sp. TaxID=1940281 RepID=UPI001DC9101A|nr:FAD-binding oxidoreductase [Hoeflea sp.]MBU4531609.1 FAD-binding oxidoreductase [Alphaproteobacteria bacterium]MBU4544466.1 FAD-binding oxidoreductase [Alphaproteobacteria bacterium]MBU4552697.1 FAD-binding oxidoreductase [Alphaproteobacteria bacterium]MBV1724885.1 FAD-binding oxidoreductase [Hoeflea sp.]MBV1760905.1 FAD-binding oxidoreductase [Hoeflea sp.]
MATSGKHDSWGRVVRHLRPEAKVGALAGGAPGGFLPFGNGRSYGDSCHNDRGRLIPMRPGAAIRAFDPDTGLLTADSGVLLSDILALVMPHGFFLEVTPGTAQVTLGGAIANDVHGKNHHRRGTFGGSVISFELLGSDGASRTCSVQINPALFAATIGGMGLTGIIESATIRLMPVPSANVRQTAFRFSSIDGYFDAIDAIDAGHEYSVAWIDQLARGANLGRGVMMAGDHAEDGGAARAPSAPRLAVPFAPPVNLLNRLTLKAFNGLYYGRAPKQPSTAIVGWSSYFHPLDAITGWNRLYGPRGLFQHQSVYPSQTARETTISLIECAQKHGAASFLTVLKRFGDAPSPGLMSFPRPGFTLTLDFANSGDQTLRMLDALDEIVLDAGGALNPYKDQRMSPHMFEASFPIWRELDAMRDPALMSDFWRRTAMKLGETEQTTRQSAAAR